MRWSIICWVLGLRSSGVVLHLESHWPALVAPATSHVRATGRLSVTRGEDGYYFLMAEPPTYIVSLSWWHRLLHINGLVQERRNSSALAMAQLPTCIQCQRPDDTASYMYTVSLSWRHSLLQVYSVTVLKVQPPTCIQCHRPDGTASYMYTVSPFWWHSLLHVYSVTVLMAPPPTCLQCHRPDGTASDM